MNDKPLEQCTRCGGFNGAHAPDCPQRPGGPAPDPFWGIWRCSCCGELRSSESGSAWRWNGQEWEHAHGQAGHFPARNFGNDELGEIIQEERKAVFVKLMTLLFPGAPIYGFGDDTEQDMVCSPEDCALQTQKKDRAVERKAGAVEELKALVRWIDDEESVRSIAAAAEKRIAQIERGEGE